MSMKRTDSLSHLTATLFIKKEKIAGGGEIVNIQGTLREITNLTEIKVHLGTLTELLS